MCYPRHLLMVFVALICPPEVPGVYAQPTDDELTRFFHAIAEVESNHNDNAVGDGGDSIGRYQIQRPYWIDATEYDRSIGGRYEDVTRPSYARRVMLAYWQRYAADELRASNWEALARLHNSGPAWRTKTHLTDEYWRRVRAAMERQR